VAQPEFSIDLNGALLEHGEKASSRRNVFLVTTVLGLQVLLQCDSAQLEEEWYKAIHKAIKDLASKSIIKRQRTIFTSSLSTSSTRSYQKYKCISESNTLLCSSSPLVSV
jgi:hypothetical protein